MRFKGETVFVHSAQTVTASGQNACAYDESMSGSIIYAYVGGNPVNFTDPMGLALVSVNLPGLGATYLDDSFAPSVQKFTDEAAQNGVNLHFNSAYRTPTYQATLQNDPTAITPAGNSLHSAGFAVDVNYSSLPVAQQTVVSNAATAAGLNWGGNFQQPDPPHFYMEPSVSRATAIQNASQDYLRLTSPTPIANCSNH